MIERSLNYSLSLSLSLSFVGGQYEYIFFDFVMYQSQAPIRKKKKGEKERKGRRYIQSIMRKVSKSKKDFPDYLIIHMEYFQTIEKSECHLLSRGKFEIAWFICSEKQRPLLKNLLASKSGGELRLKSDWFLSITIAGIYDETTSKPIDALIEYIQLIETAKSNISDISYLCLLFVAFPIGFWPVRLFRIGAVNFPSRLLISKHIPSNANRR